MCCPGSVMAIVTTGEDGRIFFLNRQNMSVKMADESSKSGSLPKQSQWNRSTKPMESFSKINGIAERFHWNGLTKPPVYLSKSSTFACRNRCCCPHTSLCRICNPAVFSIRICNPLSFSALQMLILIVVGLQIRPSGSKKLSECET